MIKNKSKEKKEKIFLTNQNQVNNQNKKKLFIMLIIITLFFWIFGNMIIKNTKKYLEEDFISSRINIANCIANAIDPTKHDQINFNKSVKDPNYQYYQNFLNNIIKGDENISYLYTLTYDQNNDYTTYTIDWEIVEYDTIRVESEYIAFTVISKDWEIFLNYDDNISKSFKTNKNNYQIEAKIKDNWLFINWKKIFTILWTDPFLLKSEWISWNIEDYEVSEPILVPTNKWDLEFYLSFSFKWQPASNPWIMYVDDPEVLNNIKSVIIDWKNMIENTDWAYWKITTIFAPIFDKNWHSSALVWIDYKQKNIEENINKILNKIKNWLIILYFVSILIIFSSLWWKKYVDKFLYSFNR